MKIKLGKESARCRRQSGVLPYFLSEGRVRFVVVTNSRGSDWIVPKGNLERGMSARASARLEAYEEAGIRGRIENRPIGSYVVEKRGRLLVIESYLMEVRELLPEWPEMRSRSRREVGARGAISLVSNSTLRALLRQAVSQVGSGRSHAAA